MSEDAANLNALLVTGTVQVDHVYDGKTAFGQLIAGLNNDNFYSRFAAMQLLVKHKADVNIPDECGHPPIVTVLKSNDLEYTLKRIVVDMLLQQTDAGLDSEEERLLKDQFPEMHAILGESTDSQLLNALRCGNEDHFKRGCNLRLKSTVGLADFVLKSIADDDKANPMKLAIDNRLSKAVEELLHFNAPVGLSDNGYDAICSASAIGQHQILGLLLAKSQKGKALAVSASRAIASVIPRLGFIADPCRLPISNVDYQLCLDHLLTVCDIDLNCRHANGNTLLHLAVQYKLSELIAELLRRGARMGLQNARKTVAIADIDADLLAEHLDACISESGNLRPGEHDYELILRFENLRPSDSSCLPEDDRDDIHFDDNEMTCIEHIVGAPHLQHLVKHPLIASFMFLKWNRLLPTFYLTFTCYVAYFATLIAYIMGRNYNVRDTYQAILMLGVLSGNCYMMLCETVNLIMAPGHFFRRPSTYMR